MLLLLLQKFNTNWKHGVFAFAEEIATTVLILLPALLPPRPTPSQRLKRRNGNPALQRAAELLLICRKYVNVMFEIEGMLLQSIWLLLHDLDCNILVGLVFNEKVSSTKDVFCYNCSLEQILSVTRGLEGKSVRREVWLASHRFWLWVIHFWQPKNSL